MSEFANINFEATSRITGDVVPFKNAKVKVFGVGGAGGNTVNRMKQMNIDGVEFYAINTDAMALDQSLADHKILIGEKSTKNLGAGMDPEMGRKAVEENVEDLREAMKGADLVFVTAGMGGGTGTGAAPVVASVARELGILTVAVVTKPFRFEGNVRNTLAMAGVRNLREAADTIIVIENKKLLNLIQNTNKSATVDEAFKMADEILGNAVQSICSIMFRHGLVHVDFADIRKVMLKGGNALMGTGSAEGEGRGIAAADAALSSPLLEDIDIEGASGVLINVSHGENYSLLEHNEAMEHIYDTVGEKGNPNIIIGDITLPELGDKVCITIIATGCGGTSRISQDTVKAAASSVTAAPKQAVGVSTYGSISIPQQPVQQAPATSGVQKATPRPTSTNFAALAHANAPQTAAMAYAQPQQMYAQAYAQPQMAYAQPMYAQQPVQQGAYAQPSYAASGAMPAFGETASYASSRFDAQAPVAEKVASATKSVSREEMPGMADADPLSNGNFTSSYGSVSSSQTSSLDDSFNSNAKDQDIYKTPSIMRMKEDSAFKSGDVDYDLPAFLRNSDAF